MIDLVFLVYGLLLAAMVGVAVWLDIRRRRRRRLVDASTLLSRSTS
ncbi:hypothetical protein [Croceibacterium aestuarii]|nr:hypothetical protein [Croceibacterium sp. D39]